MPHAPEPSERGAVTVPPAAPPAASPVLTIAVLTVLALYFGRDILQPLALAGLLSLALAPAVKLLHRIHIPRVAAILGTVALTFMLILGVAGLVTSQFYDLVQTLPRYEQNLLAKIDVLRRAMPRGGPMDRIARLGADLEQAVKQAAPAPATPTASGPPVPVQVQEDRSPLKVLHDVLAPVLHPLVVFGLMLVFTIFMLLQREDLRDRLIRLAGSGDLQRTTSAINDAAHRLSMFMLAQLSLNMTFGALIALGLWAIGLPNPLLWGMLGGLMRFVPFVGSFIAAALPVLLAVAVSPGWVMPVLVLALFVVLELLAANFAEPLLYGSRTGMSPLSVLVSAIVWTTIWGPVGLLLATPLSVCLVVLGRHVPGLHFLEVLLGDTQPLSPEVQLYQRMLANAPDEALHVVEEFAEDKDRGAVYDSLVIPALVLADRDRARGHLSREHQRQIVATMADIVDLLADDGPVPPPRRSGIVCVPVHGELDHSFARVVVAQLAEHGIQAEASARLPGSGDGEPGDAGTTICLCTLAFDANRARRKVKRLRMRLRDVEVMVLALTGGGDRAAGEAPEAHSVRELAALLLPAPAPARTSDLHPSIPPS
ncbi:MAG: AI-2E family transporter [Solirubrobacterales bacterium]